MRLRMLPILFLLPVALQSCTLIFEAFIRNTSKQSATIDVYLLRKSQWKTLPNQISMTQQIVEFKSGYKNRFEEKALVNWVDTTHFQLTVPPGTSIDLSDLVGKFLNSHPVMEVRAIVTTAGKTDTLMNGIRDFRHDKFGYKNKAFKPILYYDIQ